ncbi:MAG TPA: tripartite tricarboxylate transporter substrate binding protein [Burkholderiales bacterium]|nr:tripartite tricarboxylate transporter substrate binding protein [Burkholderiales bacterium]
MVRSLILLAALVALPAAAQDYPAREIRSICNFSAGSGADIVVRFYSDRLSKLAGKPVVVENRPGAQGLVATDFVAKAKNDGYTILITPASSTLATAPHIFKHVPFDPLKDFQPVTTIASLAFVVAVDAATPIRTIDELVASVKAKPSNGFYGTGSNTGQVAAELLKEKLGLKTVYVPYKVTTDALTGLLLGQVDWISYDATWAVTQREPKGKLRILAVTSAKRAGALPDVPTLSELGFGEFDITPWWAVTVPAGTPRPIVDKLAGWFNQITNAEDTKTFLSRASLDAFPGSPEQMAALLKTETERWGRWVSLAKIEKQ